MSYFNQHIRVFLEDGRTCNKCWAPLLPHEKGNCCEHRSICDQMKNDFVVRKDWYTGEVCAHYYWSGTWFPLTKETWVKCAKGCGREGPLINYSYGMCLDCHAQQKVEPKNNPMSEVLERQLAFLQNYTGEEEKKIEKKDDPFGYALEKFYKKAALFRGMERDTVYMTGKHKAVVDELNKRGHKATPVLGLDGWHVSIYNSDAEREEALERDFRERMETSRERGDKYAFIDNVPKFIEKLRGEGFVVKKDKLINQCKVLIPRSVAEKEEIFERDFRERLTYANKIGEKYIFTEGTPEFLDRLRHEGHTVTKVEDTKKMYKVLVDPFSA
ncbi:hypothetical protein [Cedratvirus kamchatka]|uniref:Uncharacterized protein n=1 Tax=Cedratvirus kamchatka TaxID=2716914 RepID=A0A6G8MX01_9VIRU|nr:hypothetical protein [Cedratvirus kamchatka]